MRKWLWLLCFVAILHAGDEKPWTWKDSSQRLRTRAELDAILEAHNRWIATETKEGKPANLSGAELSEADLSSAMLRRANLSGAKLTAANLAGANLAGADFSNAILLFADLHNAVLVAVDLRGTDLRDADLGKAVFEPSMNPAPELIASAKLSHLIWLNNSGPIFALRKSLLDRGFGYAAKQVTAAIHRNGQSWLEGWLFDRTCEWGANWLRPLYLIGILSLICTLIYWAGMHFERRSSGLYLVATGQPVTTNQGKERVHRIDVRFQRVRVRPSEQLDLDFVPQFQLTAPPESFNRMLGREFTAVGTAFLFSLMSVFNIGFREFNFGRWIRMMQSREFDIRARGWMRIVSGVQSLLGVALVTLSLLSYFGRPFD